MFLLLPSSPEQFLALEHFWEAKNITLPPSLKSSSICSWKQKPTLMETKVSPHKKIKIYPHENEYVP